VSQFSPATSFLERKIERRKFVINRARRFLSLSPIDKTLPPRRNLIPTISLFLSLSLSRTPSRRKGESPSSEQTFMKTRLAGFLYPTSPFLAPTFFTRVGRIAPKVGCDVRHEKFSPMQFLQLVNSPSLRRPLHFAPRRRG